MSLRELAGSVLICSFEGATLAGADLEPLREIRPGGVLFFSRNAGRADDVAALTGALRSFLSTDDGPPIVALDQEGGRVARLHDGVPALPAAMAFGAAGDPALTERAASELGAALAALGFTLDLAPCADLALVSDNTVIGTRAYGSDPHAVATHVAAFVRGMTLAGVDTCVKHAPGHGATHVDSHLALPALDLAPQTLTQRELIPFRAATGAGAASVMLGHLVVSALDAQRPATTSPAVVEFVRASLSFAGPILTDCLTMDAIANTVGVAPGAVAALAAGVDGVLVSSGGDEARAARDAIEAAVRDGSLSVDRLEEAAQRLRTLRRARSSSHSRSTAESGAHAAARAITIVRGSPLFDPRRPVTVISFEGKTAGGAVDAEQRRTSLSAALRQRRYKSEHLRVGLDPERGEMELLLGVLAAQPARNLAVVLRRARLHPAQRAAVDAILARFPDALLVAASEPFDLDAFPHAARMVAAYGDDEATFAALADVLGARAPAAGRLPVPLAVAGERALA